MFGDQPIHHPSIVAKISGGEPLPAGAHTVGRVRDAPALLSLRFTFGNYLVKFALVERTDVREIRLSQVVQPAMLDLGPEPSAYDVLAVAYNCGLYSTGRCLRPRKCGRRLYRSSHHPIGKPQIGATLRE